MIHLLFMFLPVEWVVAEVRYGEQECVMWGIRCENEWVVQSMIKRERDRAGLVQGQNNKHIECEEENMKWTIGTHK